MKEPRLDTLGGSFSKLQETADRITFNPSVPEDVVNRFHLVKKLVIHSYYEYEFADLDVERSLLTFEMALGARYSKDTQLIRWATDRNILC